MTNGKMLIELRTAGGSLPVQNALVRVKSQTGQLLHEVTVNNLDNGNVRNLDFEVPDIGESLVPNSAQIPYGRFDVEVLTEGFRPTYIEGVQVFPERQTVLEVELLPLGSPETPETSDPVRIKIGEHNLRRERDPLSPEPLPPREPSPQIHAEPFIPEYITVHLGSPTNSSARNVTVPFPDYIKNVASCEIYPTWPEESLRANILAQISLVLNRVFTEWYRSRGYNFDITNSTAYDQYYVDGGNIYQSISDIVDEIFNIYIRKPGRIEPYYAEYCNGSTVTCPGMSQWGTVTLANQGFDAVDILENYYGDIELVENNDLIGGFESYPGNPLTIGSSGREVYTVQEQLNRIAINYPAIPIAAVDGIYGPTTAEQVRVFQRLFNLTQDGIVGKGTWYELSRVYVGVKKLAELTSEGQRADYASQTYPGYLLKLGARGSEIQEIQLYLSTIAKYNKAVPSVEIDGRFGQTTYNSVVGFQREYGLLPDGVVGRDTWNRLVDVYNGIKENVNVPGVGEAITILPFPGRLLRLGSSGENVRYIQRLVNALAYTYALPVISVDGFYGSQTRNAVRSFQEDFSLLADGIVGKDTWEAMGYVYSYVKNICLGERNYPGNLLGKGDRGIDVLYAQVLLSQLSKRYSALRNLTPDGDFGSSTEASVKRFQEFAGVDADGVIGRDTWYELYRRYSEICPSQGRTQPAASPEQDQPSQPPMKIGTSGEQVKQMKKRLIEMGYMSQSFVADNFYGMSTKRAVERFQADNGLTPNGNADERTFSLIMKAQ